MQLLTLLYTLLYGLHYYIADIIVYIIIWLVFVADITCALDLLTLGRYVWVIFDQVWGQDGWILAEFFFACLWTETESRPINTQKKKERGQYQAILTEQAWSIKDLLHGFEGNFSCGRRRVVPSGQDGSILPARVANNSAGFDSSCPLAEPAI